MCRFFSVGVIGANVATIHSLNVTVVWFLKFGLAINPEMI